MGIMNFFSNNRSDQQREDKIQKMGRTSRLEQMEDRIMLSAAPWTPDLGAIVDGPSKCDVEVSLNSDSGTLKIVGSPCDDSVSIESGRMGLDVTANGETTHFTPLQKWSVDLITFTGSEGDDHFENSTGKDTWAFGGDGDDTIQTSWGDDLIHSGEGDDVIKSGAGSDIVTGAEGADTINSGSGNDFVYGHDGDDSIEAGNGDDNIQGGDGADRIKAGSGDDVVDGGAGNDTLYGQSGDDQIEGEDGNDRLYGNSGEDVLYGDDGNDYLSGSDDADRLYGGDGADTVYGGDGNDELSGGSGKDRLYGGDNDDVIEGGSGSDRLYGQSGSDEIDGSSGSDRIDGGSGNDLLHGGSGKDSIWGGTGDDDLYGDGGDDDLSGQKGDDGLFGGDGSDSLNGGDGQDRFLYESGDELEDVKSEDAKLQFKSGDKDWTEDEIELIDEALAVLHRATGDDTLLETSGGSKLKFARSTSHSNPDVTAENNSALNKITFFDHAFDISPDRLQQTLFHEIGHNWDNENDGWDEFKDISGWTWTLFDTSPGSEYSESYSSTGVSDDHWWYLTETEFSREYGSNKPHDDFAEIFALYFCDEMNIDYDDESGETNEETINRVQEKHDFVEDWVSTL